MDRKMRSQVTKPIRKAEMILKKAEKANMKLANFDEKVRDPQIKKFKELKKESNMKHHLTHKEEKKGGEHSHMHHKKMHHHHLKEAKKHADHMMKAMKDHHKGKK